MGNKYLYSNLHVHSPHSFSYFASMDELARKAGRENVSILGISDFNTWEGFGDFRSACEKYGIFPSFGIEITALSREDQDKGRLINDPRNPGRVYLCAKGIPPRVKPGDFALLLRRRVKEESSKRMEQAVELMNGCFAAAGLCFRLSFREVAQTTASGWVRERHLARAASEKIVSSASPGRAMEALGLPSCRGPAELQDAVRSKLLKAGGAAYVPEEERAFPTLDEARRFFLALGGIPAYPVLADGSGELTGWEKTPAEISRRLRAMGYHAVEFIPHRNSLRVLMQYAASFNEAGFAVTAGSEHNSPAALPLKPVAADAARLPESLLKIFERGAFCVAAHQERKQKGLEGFVDGGGNRTGAGLGELAEEGEIIIRRHLNA